MRAMDAPGGPTVSGEPEAAAARTYALDVLAVVQDWVMIEARWQVIADLLAGLEDAAASGDPRALTEASSELELAGPVRLTPIGGTPLVTAPTPVLFRLSRLVRELGGDRAAGHGGEGGSGDRGR